MTFDEFLVLSGWCVMVLAVYGLARWVGLSM
jgi:hypothetical protein